MGILDSEPKVAVWEYIVAITETESFQGNSSKPSAACVIIKLFKKYFTTKEVRFSM
jgi:hypothetical protein